MVELKLKDGIAGIFLNRPGKSNALSSPLLEELLSKMGEIQSAPGLRAVVLGGHGRNFCGGADLHDLSELKKSTAGKFIRRIHACCDAVRKLPVPVVARLQGAVIGAGLELAASCDLRIAAEDARFAMPEVRFGIPSVVEAALLPRLVGAGRAAWLVLTGEPIDAKTALDWGLVEEVAPDLDRSIEALLGKLKAADRSALMAQKRLLRLWQEAPLGKAVAASIGVFARSYASGKPGSLMRKLRR